MYFVCLAEHTDAAAITKERYMLSPRRLATLTVPMAAGAILFSSPAVANADEADNAYLAQLRTLGLTWPQDHDAPLTTMGRLVCEDIAWGYSYDQIAQAIHANLNPQNVTLGEVASMVSVAHSTYCPDLRVTLNAARGPI
jgi:hypothetical protein